MSLHDTYARTTPFELAFPDPSAVDALLGEVREEAVGRGTDPSNPQVFVTMGAVGAFIGRLQGPEAPPEAIHQYGALVYHALHFHEAGQRVFVLVTGASRYLVEGSPGDAFEPPTPAGYLQLPQHLFWAAAAEGAPPESVDGIFWTASEGGVLHCLLVTGVRPDRPGFGTLVVPEAPMAEGDSWLEAKGRVEGDDFSSTLPGADIDGLYAIETAGEVLKLVSRFFAYLGQVPQAVGPEATASGTPQGPPPSSIPYRRVTLHA